MKEIQVMEGMEAGYNEIIKLSDIILSVPMLFAAFAHPKKGPSLARAIVEILSTTDKDTAWIEYILNDETWGRFKEDNDTDKATMDLIKDNVDDLCHYFQQFGLGCACIGDNLKKLTLHNVEDDSLEDDEEALLFFKRIFPILFECLEAKFGLMPSTTRIIEQKHRQIRDSLKILVGQDFTDAQHKYISNMDFKQREKRRKVERKRRKEKLKSSAEDDINGSPQKKRKQYQKPIQIVDDDSKEQQIKIGKDVLEVGKLYTPEEIDKYPDHIQESAKVKAVDKKGTTSIDRALKRERVQAVKDRFAKQRQTKFPTMEEMEQNAEVGVDNDKGWKPLDKVEMEMEKDVNAILTQSYWKEKVPKDFLLEEMGRVFI